MDEPYGQERLAKRVAGIIKSEKLLNVSDLKDGLEVIGKQGKVDRLGRQVLDMSDQRWHGGGDTVVAGENITITPNPGGTKTISADIDADFQYKVFITVGFSDADYICDGVDDYIQIQQAISYLNALGGGTVFIKPGTYNISAHIIVYDNIEIFGTPATILVRGANLTFEAIFSNQYYLGSASSQNKNIKIHDLVLDGGGDTNSYNQFRHCIGIYGVDGMEVYNIRFLNLSGDGIYVSSTSSTYTSTFLRAKNIRIYANNFVGTKQNRNGISVIDAEDIVISGNNFYRMTSSSHPGAIDLEPNDTDQLIRNVVISDNTFDDGGKKGIQFYDIFPSSGRFDTLVITGNTFQDNDDTDIFGLSWANVSISGNTHRTPTSRGIEVNGTSSLNISGESMYFTGSTGIYILNAGAGLNISGNSIISSAGHGIWLSNIDNPNVVGNTIRDWGTAANTFNGIYGENEVTNANISGNVITDISGTHTAIKSADTSTGWRIGQNQITNASSDYSLVGTNTVAIATSGTNTGDQNLSTYVVGPASATDNALVRFDLTTGKLIQNSSSILADTGILTLTNTTDTASNQALVLQGDRATPTNGDTIYQSFLLSDSAGTQIQTGKITSRIGSTVAGSVTSDMRFTVRTSGTETDELVLNGTILAPLSNDGLALGSGSLGYADLFLASGGVINWNNGNVTLTHAANKITIAGGQQTFAATTTSYASFNLPTGTAPSSPVDGDVWREDNTDTGLKIRVNGVTKTVSLV